MSAENIDYIEYPAELFEGNPDHLELAARLGRWAVLQEMGFFGDKSNLALALGQYEGRFNAAVRKRFSGVYGDVAGCHPADIEVAAEMLGVFDAVYDYELEQRSQAA